MQNSLSFLILKSASLCRLIAEEYKAVKAAEMASQVIIAELKRDLDDTKRSKVKKSAKLCALYRLTM
jgi:hypothetical protein